MANGGTRGIFARRGINMDGDANILVVVEGGWLNFCGCVVVWLFAEGGLNFGCVGMRVLFEFFLCD